MRYRHPAARSSHSLIRMGFCAFLLTMLLRLPCLAGDALLITADEQFAFAEACFNQAQFRQAIDEYRRFIHFFPEDGRTDTARFLIGRSYMKKDAFEEAIEAFRALLGRSPGKDLLLEAYRSISACQVALRQYDAAVLTLTHLMGRVPDPDVTDEANYRIGWIYIETGAFDRAREYFNRIRPGNRIRYDIDGLFTQLEKAPFLEKKIPVLAGASSILPGLGYLYCDRPKDALISFIINGAMLYAAYAAVDSGNSALGAILAFVELGFYTANIYGSVTSAHKFNRRVERDFIENLKRNARIQISSTQGNKGVLLAVQYRF